ncbi:hypothetical protein [Flammeovirga sp. EKP202]|uniref:hypothetical protein n=1 Tax=Flammeovirga sp. EKP202 TaxID=2770592 RepID=UPI00165F812F|nr:hypothetical protein [Flammeovirga sp. EKP202]MBD0403353.1 hypothetical protein [Flammeovirga sp. EKP202]
MRDYKIPYVLYLIVIILFGACEDKEDSLEEEKNEKMASFNGEYHGYIYDSDNQLMTDWFIKIEDGILFGKFDLGDQYQQYEGGIDENGVINAISEFDDSNMRQLKMLTITIKASVSLENGTMSGTWSNQNGHTGSLEGLKFEDRIDLFDGEYYGNSYTSSEEVITDWYFKIEKGVMYGKYSSAKDYERFDAKINENGTFTSTSIYISGGNEMQINSSGTIYLDNGSILGTWSNGQGDEGTFEGSKI